MGIGIGEIVNNNFYLSENYENSLSTDKKKKNGIYYTPKVIVDYIIKETIQKHDIVNNPYPKIVDISCGCGNFLLEVYDTLYDLLEKHIYDLKDRYGEYFSIDNIHNHIISNCIYGFDTDKEAIEILKNSLLNKDKDFNVNKINIFCIDSLIEDIDYKFDYIIGNPPYVGSKILNKEYKKEITKKYSDVYRGKSDLYFCFYKRIIGLLKKDGISSIVTPRYFLESPSGVHIRKYLRDNSYIYEIVDFLGANVFKDVGVSSLIFTLKNSELKNESINVLKIKDESLDISNVHDINELKKENMFNNIIVNQKDLEDDWIILNKDDKVFINNINKYCNYTLEEIATSFQGIITGCDRAFVVSKDTININNKLLKSWLKNKNIKKYIINNSNLNLIYSDDISSEDDETLYYISKYKDKLKNRRECKRNIRKWYELQWGRDKSLFEQKKIMYPYKSIENRFAIDYNNSYCSADIYSFIIKENYKDIFSYEYIVGILNSSVYDKYFKLIAKKMSKGIYDYYPNKVMKLKIFKDNNYNKIENLSKEIITELKKDEINEYKINEKQEKINTLIKNSINV